MDRIRASSATGALVEPVMRLHPFGVHLPFHMPQMPLDAVMVLGTSPRRMMLAIACFAQDMADT